MTNNALMTNTVINIQFLRAVAAILVVVYHLQPVVNASFGTEWDNYFGAFGVDIFFVISGFIMFYTNRNMDQDPRTFITNRLLRIVPLYWLATFIIVALFVIGFRPNGLHFLTLPALIKSMVFVPSQFPDGRRDLVLLLGWTLMYELYFYAVFASTFSMRSLEKSFVAITSFFILGIVANAILGPFPYLVDYYLSTITLEFVFGAAIAIVYIRWRPTNSNGAILLAAGLVTLGMGAAAFNSELVKTLSERDGLRFLLFGVPAFLIVAGALVFEKSEWRFKNRTALLLGAASYSLYLFHPFLLQPTVKSLRLLLPSALPFSLYFTVLAAVMIALAGAILVHLQIETRIMSYGKKYVRKFAREWSLQRALPLSKSGERS